MSIERELRAFRAILAQNLSRMAEHANAAAAGQGAARREQTVLQALATAWDLREQFDPTTAAWITWFDGLLWQAARSPLPQVVASHDWLYVALGNGQAVSASEAHDPEFEGTCRPLKFGDAGALNIAPLPHGAKNCPPCWRCRYFDGWLPEDEDEALTAVGVTLEPEIEESCLRLDRNKLAIAKWVRGRGLENFEDQEDSE